MLKRALFIIIWLSSLSVSAQDISGLYYGQALPGDSAVVFASGLISLPGRYEHDITFSQDGKEMFFSLSEPNWSDFKIYHSKCINEQWTTIDIAEFSKQYKNTEIIFSPDSKSLLFASNRPPGKDPWDFGIFKVTKNDTEWSNPSEIGIKALQPNGNDGTWHPAIAEDSTVYFSSNRSGNYDIYYSRIENGAYVSFENLGDAINTSSNDWYPWVAPDNSFLIFSSERDGGFGGSDLYISFKNDDGSWVQAVNLGSTVNSSAHESSPRITPDGKFLFFTRRNGWDGDFYWISAKTLLLTSVKNPQPSTPDHFTLSQNYPNPFNPFTRIAYNLHKSSNVMLIIYNISGQEIERLVDGFQNTGEYEMKWQPSGIPSGIYFYRLVAGENSVTKKIILQK